MGKLNNSSLKLLHAELNANAISIPSNQSGGAHGPLTLLHAPADCLVLTGSAFIPPVNPGTAPAIAATATSYQISEGNCQITPNIPYSSRLSML
jgi:hypothetical protein